jgi:hypothetical protein
MMLRKTPSGSWEERVHPRVRTELRLTLPSHSNLGVLTTSDISKTGARIRATAPLPRGTTVRAVFNLGSSGAAAAEGCVIWSDRGELGIHFQDISPELAAGIDGLQSPGATPATRV